MAVSARSHFEGDRWAASKGPWGAHLRNMKQSLEGSPSHQYLLIDPPDNRPLSGQMLLEDRYSSNT